MKDQTKIAATVLLKERGWWPEEIKVGLAQWRDGAFKMTQEGIAQCASFTEDQMVLRRDKCYVGTELYQGKAYFWSHEFRHLLRGTNPKMRREIHGRFLAEELEPAGDSPDHRRILREFFGAKEVEDFLPSPAKTRQRDCGYCTVAGGAGAWACPKHGEEAGQ